MSDSKALCMKQDEEKNEWWGYELLAEWWDRVCECWRCIKNRSEIMWAWFPVIWRDEDYDSHYILIVMEHKLKRLKAEIARNARHVGWEKDVRNIAVALELLRREIDSDFRLLDGDSEFCTCKKEDLEVLNLGEDGKYISPFCEYCRKYGLKAKTDREHANWNYLFDHLKKNMKRWWD